MRTASLFFPGCCEGRRACLAQLLFYSRHTLTEAMESLYPGFDNLSALYNEYAFRALDEAILNYVNYLWETLKIN